MDQPTTTKNPDSLAENLAAVNLAVQPPTENLKMDRPTPTFLTLPPEIRLQIYECCFEACGDATMVLKQQIEHADPDIDTDSPVDDEEDDGGEDDEERDEDDEDGEGEDDDEDEEDDEEEDDVQLDTNGAIITDAGHGANVTSNSAPVVTEIRLDDEDDESADEGGAGQATATPAMIVTNVFAGDAAEADEDDDEDDGEDDDDGEEDDENAEDEDASEDADMDDGPPLAPEPDIDGMKAILERRPDHPGRQTQYRHMFGIMQLSHAPPPLALLQTNKQVYDECIHHYYGKAALYWDVTASFAHESFFREMLEHLLSNTNGPLLQIRRIFLRFVWDSELMPHYPSGPVIEAAILPDRINQMESLLNAMPKLERIQLNYHDTTNSTPGAIELLSTVVEKLVMVTANNISGLAVDLDTKTFFPETGVDLAEGSLLKVRRDELALLSTGNGFR
ncbi:hypothetical protein BT63DRAFT_425139 [Microthyrium microscopicum]|uniref:Uncharacterized protein n=1 Tax=Microthyrium microscopicum TaxID=703497 RepID=A0A6A6UAZ1_9PEZI|nr:hypothetical protein BT63DRAFT_425139 [Microthyrium microscopicum]